VLNDPIVLEFFSGKLSTKDRSIYCPNLTLLVNLFNNYSSFVVSTILSEKIIKARISKD
jgi:hypothetical protein